MKRAILVNWNFMRFLRLVMGIAIMVQAVVTKEFMFGVIGLLIVSTAVFNTGCCGAGACCTATKQYKNSSKDIPYEEVV